MHETLTVGMVVYPLLALLAGAFVMGGILFILSIFADAFKH